ncbi:carbohydrate kinase family protein [Kosmotoga pacifica]|uniref:Ribokinase n=1 Tax=Kosmotoga pacifica TaxID=1330330 RepID=A0A0G2ZBW9_9BACT|nr:carbohydrate kinase [Kosmotoga pacifica]AKI97049.1 ribokinase [Kosmotoga pacifica]
MANPILCAGEVLFDFLSKNPGAGLGETTLFEKRPGGSPFNIAVGLRRLGIPVAFLGKVGMDEFGDALLSYLISEGIDTRFVVRSPNTKTSLAFAAIDKHGKPVFRFYRDNAADVSLKITEIPDIDPQNFSLYHCGSISLLEEPSASTYLEIFRRFVKSGVKTSFDPNIRRSLIKNEKSYRTLLTEIIANADIIKLSDEDLEYITGEKSPEKAVNKLPIKNDTVIFVTLGSKGSLVCKDKEISHIPGYNVSVSETTGCGDSFMAAILSHMYKLDKEEIARLSITEFVKVAKFANAEAAIVATRYGAADSMPYKQEVEEFLSKQEN